jgi:hypothetical protein
MKGIKRERANRLAKAWGLIKNIHWKERAWQIFKWKNITSPVTIKSINFYPEYYAYPSS